MKALNACLAAALLLGSSAVSAGAYKCTDAKGKVSFQQTPCPSSAQGTRLNVGTEWRLLSSESYGEWGNSDVVGYNEIYIDPEHIVTVDGYPRVAFKKVNRIVKAGREGQPDQFFYFYADCATGKFSNYKKKKDERPGTPGSNWNPHHWTMGTQENARTVFDAACRAKKS